MAAAFRACRRRGIVVLASGTAISLTALTGGITPALAEPGDQPVITTPVSPPKHSGQSPPQAKSPGIVAAPPSRERPSPVVVPSDPEPPTVTTSAVNTPAAAPEPTRPREAAPEPVPATTIVASPSNTLPHKGSAAAGAAASPTAASPSPSSVVASPPPVDGVPKLVSASPEPDAEPAPSATSTAVVSDGGQVVEVRHAETLQAPQQDVQLAKTARPVEQKPDPAPAAAIEDLRKAISVSSVVVDDRQTVRQFDRNWVRYDDYYRPILSNPYRDTMRVVYVYDNQPRIAYIPPLASVVLDVIRYAAYSFTALVFNAVGTAINVAVGSFFGGGYYPGQYLAPPPPPPPLLTYANVPVVVNYHDVRYRPFAVQRIVDVGDDAQYGEHKVLLDGVTPAWGVWTQTRDGQRQFEVHKTQQFPGIEAPREGPLPGNYQLRLANDSSSGVSAKAVYFIVADAVIATLALCAAVAFGVSRRRSRA